jgi:hypothetical protein
VGEGVSGTISLQGLFLCIEGDKHNGIKDLITVRFDEDMKQHYLPLFTDKFAAKRFIKSMNKGGAVVEIDNRTIGFVVEMCREENMIPIVDLHTNSDGVYEFKSVDLSGN